MQVKPIFRIRVQMGIGIYSSIENYTRREPVFPIKTYAWQNARIDIFSPTTTKKSKIPKDTLKKYDICNRVRIKELIFFCVFRSSGGFDTTTSMRAITEKNVE